MFEKKKSFLKKLKYKNNNWQSIFFESCFIFSAEMAAAAGPKRTRQTYTRYQTLELEKVAGRSRAFYVQVSST